MGSNDHPDLDTVTAYLRRHQMFLAYIATVLTIVLLALIFGW
jgi:hypothetical protein